MENNTTYESEIDLKDMFIYCFLHWRSALVLCLIFGLLIGGIQGFRTYKKTIASNAVAQKVLDSEKEPETVALAPLPVKTESDIFLDEALSDLNLSDEIRNSLSSSSKAERAVKTIVDTWTAIKKQEEFINNNPKMQIDPAAVSRTVTTVMVTVPGNNTSNSLDTIISEYINELQYGSNFDNVAADLKMSEADIRSLFNVKAAAGQYRDSIAAGDARSSNGLFTIETDGKDSSSSEKIMSALISALPALTNNISEMTGLTHTISVLSTRTITVEDSEYSSFIATQKKFLATLYTDLETARTALDTALSTTDGADKDKTKESASAIISPKNAFVKDFIKWGIMGFIIVFLLYGLLLAIRYALGCPKTITALTGKFPFRILGGVRDADKRLYKGNTGLDKWLRKAAGITPERSEEESIKMISSNLSVYCEEQKAFIIAGSDTLEHRKSLAASLSRIMPEKSFTVPSDILNDPEARDTLSKCDAIIFSEIYGKCSARDLSAELSLLYGTEIKVAGVVTQ